MGLIETKIRNIKRISAGEIFKIPDKVDRQIQELMMNLVPSELYHLILSYYTNKCEKILLLRVLSKSWKEITEHSLLWLECPLQFSAPRSWIIPSHSGVFTLPLNSDYQASLQSRFGTILIDRGNQMNESEETDVTRNPLDPSLHNIPNRHQQAHEIAQYYLRVFTFYHRKWWKYHRLTSKLRVYYDTLRVYLPAYMTCIKMIGTLLLALSSYFLMYLSFGSVNSWKTILGFVLLLLYLLLYLIGFMLKAYQKTLSHYLHTLIHINILKFYMNIELVPEIIIEEILMTLFILELIVVLLLLYIKIIYINNTKFLWIYITVPLWIFPTMSIIFMLKYRQNGIDGRHVVTFFGYFFYSVALTALLFAIHSDNPSNLSSLGVALITLFPLVLVEMVWILKGGYKAMTEIAFWIDRELSRRSPRISRCWWFLSQTFPDMCLEPDSDSYYRGRRALKRFWNIVFRVMAMFITVCLIVLVYIPNGLKNVALTFNQSNLPSGVGLILIIALFLQCAWLPDMRDTF